MHFSLEWEFKHRGAKHRGIQTPTRGKMQATAWVTLHFFALFTENRGFLRCSRQEVWGMRHQGLCSQEQWLPCLRRVCNGTPAFALSSCSLAITQGLLPRFWGIVNSYCHPRACLPAGRLDPGIQVIKKPRQLSGRFTIW